MVGKRKKAACKMREKESVYVSVYDVRVGMCESPRVTVRVACGV